MSEKLRNDRHFFLYAKGHYNKKNIVEDLKKITANFWMFPLEATTKRDIIEALIKIVKPITEMGIDAYSFSDFITSLRSTEVWKYGYPKNIEYDIDLAIIYKSLSMIRLIPIKNIGNLGKADYGILPKRIDEATTCS